MQKYTKKGRSAMKEIFKIAVIFAVLLAAIPSLAFLPQNDSETSAQVNIPLAASETAPPQEDLRKTSETAATTQFPAAYPEDDETSEQEDIVKVLDFTSGQVLTLDMQEYVIGAVLAEMPAAYDIEALKAQAVAARTYAYRQREKQRISPDAELMGADISNDSSKYQAYFTPARAKDFYGESYGAYSEKVREAADLTDRMILFYEDEPIVAAFHSMSSGRTESAETVWGSPVEYLIPVDSSGDKDAPTYIEEKTFSESELKGLLESSVSGADLSGEIEDKIVISERSSSGMVTKMSVGGAEISGGEFRSILLLRSANFSIAFENGNCTITTKGYGHGVGMSQYGANVMAEEGSDFKEILEHYYPGTEMRKY